MGKQETFDHGTERFKGTAKKATDALDDHEARIEKLEKDKQELQTFGIENGILTVFWVRARRDWLVVAPP